MRKALVAIFLVFSLCTFALEHIKCVLASGDSATVLYHDGDTLLLFQRNPLVEITGLYGEVTVYQYPDTNKIAFETSNVEAYNEFYPEHAQGYLLKQNGIREVFYAFDYDSLRVQIDAITVVPTCENTQLLLDGVIPSMQYRTPYGLKDYPRQCRVTYMNAKWSSESNSWVDSLAVEVVDYASAITIGSTPVVTDVYIYDLLQDSIGIVGDSLQTVISQPVAIKAHPQAVVTTRGKDGEITNEVERPTDTENTIKRSAPLEIEFRANALNADYYTWEIYKGSEPLLKRNEAQHKYVFDEPGVYSAKVTISNIHGCEYVSDDFDISVSESMLIVPNVFTPNGDHTNDEFRVVYRSIKEFHCWVYNRWGHLVYEWTDPAKGWDGNIGGRPAPEGAYYYVIRALGTDAETGYMGKPKYTKKLKKGEMPIGVYQLSGDINLLRGGK